MKYIVSLILILCACVTLAQAQTPPRNIQPPPRFPRKPGLSQTPQPLHVAATPVATTLATLAPNVITATCPEPTATLCGYIPVPLDRRHPDAATIQIYFEMYPHTNSGPAQSAILANFGGPGYTTTGFRDFAQYLFASNMDVHDLLLIDDRGRGLSATIDCQEIQHGTVSFAQSEVDCAAQLGDAASRYGSGDIAKDMDAVRAALGYDQVDYFGASYGGADVTAYATRFGKHLRSIVLDAPIGTPAVDEFARLQFRTHSDPRMVRLDCLRSPTCSPDHPDPDTTLKQLIQSIQLHPVEGYAYDANGNRTYVRIDENALLNFVVTYPTGNFTSTGEILAAARALKHGDKAPLLRLGAEGFFTLVGDSGDPTIYSVGAYYATVCSDVRDPWDWSEPVSQRKQDYAEAVSELPWDYFAPFSKSAPTGILFSGGGKQCFWWQKPTPSSPMAPHYAIYPLAPTLVLTGDIDNRVPIEETTKVAALFPNSTFVTVKEAGHYTVDWSLCAQNMVAQFIENLQPGDTSCSSTPATIWPAVGRFPLLADDARPAQGDTTGTNQIDRAERKVVSVSVATAIDALQRSIVGSGVGVCLRAGTFQTNYGSAWTTTLTNCAFASDVIVNGTFAWGSDNSLVGDLTVSGPGTAGGTLHINGFWEVPGPVGNFNVSGTLGGRQVAVLVPEA